jgi:hypothetical protein
MSTIVVEKDSWHARVYFWWYTHKYKTSRIRDTSNLCPYFRAVVFYAPARALFWNWLVLKRTPNHMFYLNMLTWSAIVFSLPVLVGAIAHKAIVEIILFLIIAAVYGAITTIFFLEQQIDAWIDARRNARIARNRIKSEEMWRQPTKVAPSKLSKFLKGCKSFLKLLGAYIRAGHDRICPEVIFIRPLPSLTPESSPESSESSEEFEI